MSVRSEVRVAADVGGTFTDICVFGGEGGEIRIAKVSSTPDDPIRGVLNGVVEAGIDLTKVALFSHGTTVATNALITRRFPRAAMVTTEGFRDIIEIRRGTREDLWDAYKDVAPPYIRRRDRLVVAERVGADGEIVTPLDEDGVRRLAHILRRREVETVAVCFINSYANPAHERRAKEILVEELPDATITASSDVLAEIFEHERFSTTVANAVLAPVVSGYVQRLEDQLQAGGYDGDLLVLHSGGGVMTPSAVSSLAVRLAGSGIAAGAIAVRELATRAGCPNAIGLDMGGTSTDISLVANGELRTTKEWHVEYGYPIVFPSIEVLTIGAGGGSLTWIDDAGALRNGPQSAGADPGPAAYGRGNDQPTNTDANLVLGRLSGQLLGGAMTLDRDAAAAAVMRTVGEPLGLDVEAAANAIIRVANANMADAVRLTSIGRGYDPRGFVLVAFGGAGALHGAALAQDLAIPTVLVPPNPGITSALGCLLVDVRHDLSTMLLSRADLVDGDTLEEEFQKLEAEARERLEAESIGPENMRLQRGIDMRYVGQWRSLEVPMNRPVQSMEQAIAAFHDVHEHEHSYRRDDAPVEIYRVTLTAIGIIDKPDLPRQELRPARVEPASRRRVVFDGGTVVDDTPIYDRTEIGAGSSLEGPAIIEQLDSTIVVPPGMTVEADEWLNLRIHVEQ